MTIWQSVWRDKLLPKYQARIDRLEAMRQVMSRTPEDPSYTEEDRLRDTQMLYQVIPAFRTDYSWQTREAQRRLDEWETQARTRLQKGSA